MASRDAKQNSRFMKFERASAAQIETSHFLLPAFEKIEIPNTYEIIKGRISMEGRQPNGDSVGFIPNNVDHF